MKRRIPMGLALAPLLFLACSPIADSPGSIIRISVTGSTANSVSMSWVVHDHSGSSTQVLNHGSENPWTVSYSNINPETFDEVYITITNSAGNTVITSGDGITVTGSSGSNKTLQLLAGIDPDVLAGVAVGDILEDNSGQLFPVTEVQNTISPHEVTIKDVNAGLDTGNWQIYETNTAYFAVWIERDGKMIGPPETFETVIGNIDFSMGSLTW